MHEDFSVQIGFVVFSHDGRVQFGWRDIETGEFHSEADGQSISGVTGAVQFSSDVMH
jgi:hypothetical protein